MFESPFPKQVAFECTTITSDYIDMLDPAERDLFAPSVSIKRLTEFATGRYVARQALKRLTGETITPILRGRSGQPLWPKGIIGAVAHGAQHAVAAVTSQIQICGLGVDLESTERHLRDQVAEYIATESELKWINEQPRRGRLRTLILFSMKESFFKAAYPQLLKHFGFKAITLTKKPGEDLFSLTPIKHFLADWLADKSTTIGYTVRNEKILSWAIINSAQLTSASTQNSQRDNKVKL